MPQELSLMDAAIKIMANEKKSFNLYDLFDRVAGLLELSEEDKDNAITKFYTDLTTSAKFVYVGDNEWSLKANEKIELWEKDGSFYKEYNEVELPEEYKIDPYAPTRKPKPAVAVEVVEAVADVPVIEVVDADEDIKKPVVEPVVEPVVQTQEPLVVEQEEEEFEEEIFEDYDDFDEDKYNEYMDSYEDQYDD